MGNFAKMPISVGGGGLLKKGYDLIFAKKVGNLSPIF